MYQLFKLSGNKGGVVKGSALVLSVIVLGIVPLAGAHPFTEDTIPAKLSSGPVGTTQVIVFYSEALEVEFSSLKVFDSSGDQIDNRDTSYYQGEESLIVTTPPLEEGAYTVTSKVLSKVDGHLVPDAFVFGIGDIVVEDTAGSPAELIFYPEAAARFPGLVGQTIVLGAAIASILIWATQRKDVIGPSLGQVESAFQRRFLSVTGAGIVAVFASNVLMLAIHTWRLEASAFQALETSFGTTWLVRMGITIALVAAWFALYRKSERQVRSHIPILAVSLILISTTTMIGHGAASEQLGAVLLDYIHSLVAAAWIGGVVFFAFAVLPALAGLRDDMGEKMSLVLIPRFSIMIVISLGIVIISGPILMWFLESNVDTIAESTYGKLIMAKIIIAAIMVGMGGYHQFGIQRWAEKNIGAAGAHKKLGRALKVESVLGIALLGVVALLVNGTLPAGEVQPADARSAAYGFSSTEFAETARFETEIFPFTTGSNEILVRVSDSQGNRIGDLESLRIKVSNPERNITPIVIDMARTENENADEFVGEPTFGFSGNWLVEIEAQKTQTANEAVSLNLLVKPHLENLQTEITEYDLPVAGKPLYPVFDGTDTIWISDTAQPRIWEYAIASGEFRSHDFDGQASQALALDGDGRVWFTDIAEGKIGFLDPSTGETWTIALPEVFPNNFRSIPASLEADTKNNIWISILTKGVILKFDQRLQEFEEYRLADQQGGPFDLMEDEDGSIWFTESGSGRIGAINPETGEIREIPQSLKLEGPEALILDGSGDIWITEHAGTGIVRYNPVLDSFERFPVSNPDSLPFGMALDRYGNIWFAQHQIDFLGVYDPQNNDMMDVPIPTETSFVQFVTADGNGDIWFAEPEGGKIGVLKITEGPASGAIARQGGAGPSLQYTELASPLIAMGIIAAALFFVKSVKDKRRLNEKVLG